MTFSDFFTNSESPHHGHSKYCEDYEVNEDGFSFQATRRLTTIEDGRSFLGNIHYSYQKATQE